MSHPRADIRDALVGLLATPKDEVYPTPAQGRVYPSRSAPLFEADLPAILVHTPAERTTKRIMSATYNTTRRLTMAVTVITTAADLDDYLDDMTLAVELAVYSVPLLGLSDLVERVDYQGMEAEIVSDGRYEHGRITMSFAVDYAVRLPEPGEATAAVLLEIHNNFDIAPHGDPFEADHTAVAELEEEV